MLAGEVYLWNSKVTIGDQTANKGDLSTAKTHFQNVINNYGLTLQDNFAKVFAPDNKQNSEIIFSFKYDENEYKNGSMSGYCYSTTTGNTINKAFDIDGNLWGDPIQIGANVNYYQYSNALWYQYDAADTRRDVTLISSWHDENATQLRGTFVRKLIGNVSALTGFRAYDSDWPVYRLALAYLSLAEIANMEGDNTAVRSNINKIRERAYGDAWDEAVYGYTPGSFAENEVAILHEKDKEFVQEGQRWWDVCRMSVSPDCGATDHLVFHNEGHIAYGLTGDLRETSQVGWDEAASIVVQPLLSTANSYRVLWPVDTNTLGADTELEQTPGYGN
ncbi:MAG: RagB/SusD family nutrient uptake outer membrane protein [Bacteroidales bacterium]|nr:RagB/SusD family nutrient uptake outer membrane protein [Bacteroidales bacterium]